VSGKVLKLNPFGAFVELDQDIHGLIHISELAEAKNKARELKEGETCDFYIISIEPENHRLGLSLEPYKEKKVKAEDETQENKKAPETPSEPTTTELK